jgi:hypothetical protein
MSKNDTAPWLIASDDFKEMIQSTHDMQQFIEFAFDKGWSQEQIFRVATLMIAFFQSKID